MGDDIVDANAPLWPSDITALCERVASRKARAGARHPVAAAVAYCARAHTGLATDAFAAQVGLTTTDVEALEDGEVAWADVPDTISALVAIPGVNFLALADLDAQLGRVA